MKRRLMLLACALALLAPAAPAFAQSCETHPAQRYAEREVLKPRHTAELAKVRFAAQALLMTESADPAKRLRGVADAGDTYEVVMERANERVTFSFRDEKNRAGTLSFFMPATIGIFEVDPRGEGGEHPTLYKEWRLASHATGDGLFKAATNRNSRVTLVLHGRGNGCTDAAQFTDWTLQVTGPRGKFSFYGKLEPAARQ
jgi:hypothetical protein